VKAEAAKMPGAGIGPSSAQENAWEKKGALTELRQNRNDGQGFETTCERYKVDLSNLS